MQGIFCQECFSWDRVRCLFGLDYHDKAIQSLLFSANINPNALWREMRVGIYSMPPYDQQPSPIAEIDLIPSYHVRLRFKHARLVSGARTSNPMTFVFASLTYSLESEHVKDRFLATLPYGIVSTDSLDTICERVGSKPTSQELGDKDGYVAWEDINPVLHILFSTCEQRSLRINVYLPPTRGAI